MNPTPTVNSKWHRPVIGLDSVTPARRAAWRAALGPLSDHALIVDETNEQPVDVLVSDCPSHAKPGDVATSSETMRKSAPRISQTIIAVAPRADGDIRLADDASAAELRLACELLLQVADLRRALALASHREQELEQLARRDGLTGLPNRRDWDEQFVRRWELAQRDHSPLCLALLDLNHFKQINDEYGLKVGDAVLVAVAVSLARAMRVGEYMARLGGDEFAILLTRDTASNAAARVEELAAAVERAETSAIPASGVGIQAVSHLPLSASVGWSCFFPAPIPRQANAPDNPDSLFERADAMLRANKKNLRGFVKPAAESSDHRACNDEGV